MYFLRVDERSGDLIGICGVNVDDFLIGGNWQDPRYCAERAKVKALYTFGKWESGRFTLCGVDYHQDANFNIRMTQVKYTNGLKTYELPHFARTETR